MSPPSPRDRFGPAAVNSSGQIRAGLRDFPELPEIQPLSRGRVFLLAVLFGCFVFMVGILLDWFLIRQHQPALTIIEISDGLSGFVAGGLAFKILLDERRRRRDLRQRIAIIAEMNHHVRNALQMISLSNHSAADQERMLVVQNATDRIQWALREVLPKL